MHQLRHGTKAALVLLWEVPGLHFASFEWHAVLLMLAPVLYDQPGTRCGGWHSFGPSCHA